MSTIFFKTSGNCLLILCLLAVATWLGSTHVSAQASSAAEPSRIVIVGDSTVCNYPSTQTNRGWGQYIAEYFRDGAVNIINLAEGGRSTKSFLREGRWLKALAERPDFVLIQFGHNDSHALDKPEATDAATDYKDNLRRYVDESHAVGATPILITPMVRRVFDAEDKIVEGATERSLLAYANAMKEIAVEKKVAVIDLHASSQALAEKLGPKANAELANREGDVTHFNEKGARAMADLIMKELPMVEPRLKVLVLTHLPLTMDAALQTHPVGARASLFIVTRDGSEFPAEWRIFR